FRPGTALVLPGALSRPITRSPNTRGLGRQRCQAQSTMVVTANGPYIQGLSTDSLPITRTKMARTDAIVLGAGIVGTSIPLHLAKRGLAVALVDRRGPGEETSYGNAGIIEGSTLLPHPFPRGLSKLMRIALKRATEANYHLGFLPRVAPWLLAYRSNSALARRMEFANAMRPLFARALPEHEALIAEAGGWRDLRKGSWVEGH